MIYIGADHRGFELKDSLKKALTKDNLEVVDKGDGRYQPDDDYVDFAAKVAEEVTKSPENRGILLCGSGAGVDIVANKIDGVRCALVFDVPRAIQARQHEDANVIALPADVLNDEEAYAIVKAFLETPFSEAERHVRRLEKVAEIEDKN